MGAPFPGQEDARHMGVLSRGQRRWDVFLETQPDVELRAIRGRIHFIAPNDHRTTSWVFLERVEQDVRERFGEFSGVELWHFLEALGPPA